MRMSHISILKDFERGVAKGKLYVRRREWRKKGRVRTRRYPLVARTLHISASVLLHQLVCTEVYRVCRASAHNDRRNTPPQGAHALRR